MYTVTVWHRSHEMGCRAAPKPLPTYPCEPPNIRTEWSRNYNVPRPGQIVSANPCRHLGHDPVQCRRAPHAELGGQPLNLGFPHRIVEQVEQAACRDRAE